MPRSRSTARQRGRFIAREQEERRKQKSDLVEARLLLQQHIAERRRNLAESTASEDVKTEYAALLNLNRLLTDTEWERLHELSQRIDGTFFSERDTP